MWRRKAIIFAMIQIFCSIWPPCLWGKGSRVGLELLPRNSHSSNEPFPLPCSKLGCFEIGIRKPLRLQMGDQQLPLAVFKIDLHTSMLLRIVKRRTAWTLNVGKFLPQESGGGSLLHYFFFSGSRKELQESLLKCTDYTFLPTTVLPGVRAVQNNKETNTTSCHCYALIMPKKTE